MGGILHEKNFALFDSANVFSFSADNISSNSKMATHPHGFITKRTLQSLWRYV